MTMKNYNLLPGQKTFEGLLLPFLAPYLIYTLFSTFWPDLLGMESSQVAKLIGVSLVLTILWRNYRFPLLNPRHLGIAALTTLPALALWIAPLYLFVETSPEVGEKTFTDTYFILRIINSVILVALFEELLMRVYLMEWFFRASTRLRNGTLIDSVMDTLDEKPSPRESLPLNRFSVVATTLIFTLGHAQVEYLSAILYFAFTTWIYHLTKSLWVCILIHALTNLAIAFMVKELGMHFLWW